MFLSYFAAPDHQLLLEMHLPTLLKQLTIETFLKQNCTAGLFTKSDFDSIKAKKKRKEKIEQLVCILGKGSKHQFQGFLDILRKIGLDHLASDLGMEQF